MSRDKGELIMFLSILVIAMFCGANAEFIKQWIGQNKHITIISLQDYNALPMEERAKLNENDALVFDGEFLTLNDIESYEESH